jgi:PTS system N-acetylgalactosamine-specific IIA component
MNDPVRAIVAGHGSFAEGIRSAVEQIAGRGDCFVAISNAGLGPAEIETALRDAMTRTGAKLIFTDLPAGSCTMAARRLQRADPTITVVTGAALPTILSYACGGDVAKAAEQGREALTVLEGKRDA